MKRKGSVHFISLFYKSILKNTETRTSTQTLHLPLYIHRNSLTYCIYHFTYTETQTSHCIYHFMYTETQTFLHLPLHIHRNSNFPAFTTSHTQKLKLSTQTLHLPLYIHRNSLTYCIYHFTYTETQTFHSEILHLPLDVIYCFSVLNRISVSFL
jgi:chorismate mutase